MSLRDRLRKLEGRTTRTPRSARGSRNAPAAKTGQRPRSGAGAPLAESRLVEQVTESGVVIRRTWYDLDVRHGGEILGAVGDTDPALLGRIARQPGELDPLRAVFLDTETTALGGGAGFYVFMVGLLRIEDDGVLVEQFLLPGPEREAEYLGLVLAAIQRQKHLVSFFGKSFDRHRLDDRFALLERRRPLVEMSHLDLYHAGKRLFGGRMRGCRLRDFEEELLDVRRVDDLGGAECPEAWFDYLDGVDDGPLERVFKHNLIDVLSLVTLTVRVDRAVRRPADGRQAASAGLLLLDAGDPEGAAVHLCRAQEELRDDAQRVAPEVRRATLEQARLLRRQSRPEEAIASLERLARAAPDDPEPPLIAAKIAEHDLHDRSCALQHALEHHARLASRPGGARRADRLVEARHRLERLQR